jgi:Flp pilus assembly pilin Flp
MYRRTTTLITKFIRDESGLELSEYAVAAALVAIAAAGVFAALGDSIVGKINELTGHIASGN